MGALIIIGVVVAMFTIFISNIKSGARKEESGVTLSDLKDRVEQWQDIPDQSEEDTIIKYIKSFEDRVKEWKKEGDLLEVDGEIYSIKSNWAQCYVLTGQYSLRIENLVYIMKGFYRSVIRNPHKLDEYKIHGFSLDSVNRLEKLLSDCKIHQSTCFKLKDRFPNILNGWYSINNGAYYLKKGCEFDHEDYQQYNYEVYKFEDWSIVDISCTTFDIEELTPCENPKQTHWKHFLEIEMKAKKKREEDCHKFVDEVLSQQKEYNDLQLQYEMMPSAPISDVVSFNNFCKVVSKEHGFKDYEIQNYLMLKQGDRYVNSM